MAESLFATDSRKLLADLRKQIVNRIVSVPDPRMTLRPETGRTAKLLMDQLASNTSRLEQVERQLSQAQAVLRDLQLREQEAQ